MTGFGQHESVNMIDPGASLPVSCAELVMSPHGGQHESVNMIDPGALLLNRT